VVLVGKRVERGEVKRGCAKGDHDGPDVVRVGLVGGVAAVVVDLEEDGSSGSRQYTHFRRTPS
jgi:hypothetical protein